MKNIFTFFEDKFLITFSLTVLFVTFFCQTSQAATITAKASTAWATTTTWDLNRAPQNGDDVVIPNGFNVTIGAAPAMTTGTISVGNGGTLTVNFGWTNFTGPLTVGGGTSGSMVINGFAVTIANDITINAGATVTCASATGTKTFNNFTNYGTWTNGAFAVPVVVRGNFDNEGTFTQNTGALTLSGATGGTSFYNNGPYTVTTGTITVSATTGFTFNNNSASFNAGTGTVTFTGANCSYALTGVNTTLNNLTQSQATSSLDESGMNTLTVNAILNVSGTFTAGAQINVATWTMTAAAAGVFNPNGGTVTFTGATSTMTGSPIIFNNIEVKKTAGQTLTGPATLTVNGTFTETTGNFTSGGTTTNFYGDVTLNAGTFTAGATNTNVYANWYLNSGTFTHNSRTVSFLGGDQTIGGTTTTQTFFNIIENNGSLTAPTTLNVAGALTLTAGYFYAGANMTATGTWTDNSGGFVCGTGTVTFNGGASSLTTASGQNPTFYNVVVNKTGLLSVTNFPSITTNNLTLTAGGVTYSVASATLNINGTLTLTAGALTMGGSGSNIYINGDWTNNQAAAAYVPSATNTVTFQGSTQNINGTFSTNFNHITINSTVNLSSVGMTVKGDFTNNNTFNAATNSTVTFIAPVSTTRYVYGNDPQFYNLTVAGTTNTTAIMDITNVNPFTVKNNLTLTTGTLTASAGQLLVGGNWSRATAAAFTPNGGTVKFNGAGAQSIGGTATPQTFYDIEIDNSSPGVVTASVALTISDIVTIDFGGAFASGAINLNIGKGWLNNGGTFTPSTGTVTFNSVDGYIASDGNAPSQTFNNLTIATSTGEVDAYSYNVSNLTLNGNFTLTSGGFYMPVNTMTVNGTTGVTLTAGTLHGIGQLNIGGTTGSWTQATAAIYDGTSWCQCNSIVNFNGTGAQALLGTATTQNFWDLYVNKSSGALTVTAPTTLNIKDNLTLTAGTFTDALASGILNINNNGAASSFTMTAGTFNMTGATSNLNVYGPSTYTAGTFTSSGTATYNDTYGVGTGQVVMPGSYKNLTFDNSSKTMAPGTITISGVFTPGTGTDYVTTGNTVSLTGLAGTQTLPVFNFNGTNTGTGYNNLTTTNALTWGGSLAVGGVFTYAGGTGNITLGANNLVLGSSGSIPNAPTSVHMVVQNSTGKLIKGYATGAQSYTYPIGPVAGTYLPVTLNFHNVTTAGQVGITYTSGATDPNGVAPPTVSTNWLKAYWVLDKNSTGMAFDYYSAQVQFTAAGYNTNLAAGAGGESTMGAVVWNGTSWISTPVVTSHTALNPTASYISSLGDLTFVTATAVTKTSDPTNQYVCTSGGATNITFSVGITGTPSSFQWYENGIALTNTGIYSGVTTATLTITGATTALNGNTYYCVVGAVTSGGFTSATASLQTTSGVPSQVASVTYSPATYHAGDNIVITATPGASNPTGTTYRFLAAFPESGGTFVELQKTTSTTYSINNISAYGTSIKSPGVTWLFVYASDACGSATGTFNPITVIPPTTFVNPSTCVATDGSISFPNLRPTTQYTLNYSKNGVAQSQQTLTTDGTGKLTLSNLGAGTYSNMILVVLGVGSSQNSAPADAVTIGCGLTTYNLTYNNGTNTGGATVSVCPGIANIGLAGGDIGVTYKLYEGASLVASNTPVATGAFNFAYTPVAGSTYTVVGNQGATTTNMTGSVILYAAPTAVISNSGLTGCVSPGVALGTTGSSAGAGTITGYQWKNSGGNIGGATSSTYTATATDNYTVVITTSNTCTATSSVSAVTANANPTAVISNSGLTGCVNPGVALGTTGSSAGSGTISGYQWKNSGGNIGGATSSTYTATASDNYTVVVTNSNNCSTTSAASAVIARANPVAVISNSGLTGCTNPGVALGTTGSSAGSGSITGYQWQNSGGNIGAATSSTYTVTASDNYTVVITNSNLCSTTSAASTVTANPNPVAVISGTLTGCVSPGIVLGTTGSSAGSGTISGYQWRNSGGNIGGATSSTYTATASDNYTVVITNSNLCSTTSAASAVTANANPIAVISGTLTGCVSPGVVLGTTGSSAGSGTISNYQWINSGGNIGGATNSTYTATASNNYSVLITNSNNCTNTSALVSVTANANPTSVISFSTLTGCVSPGIVLGTTGSAAGSGTISGYQWANSGGNIGSATSATYTATATETYTVIITNSNNCTAVSTGRSVTANPNPTAYNVTGGACTPSDIGLSGSQIGINYQLIRDAVTNVILKPGTNSSINFGTYNTTGSYSVFATNATTGCTANMTGVSTVNLCTSTWVGGTNTDWFTQTNWNPAAVPNICGSTIIIPSNATRFPVIAGADVQVGNMQIASGASITVTGQTLRICGDWSGSGTATNATVIGTGTVELNGGFQQTLSGNTKFNILQLDNSLGAILATDANVSVSTGVHLKDGILNTQNGVLRLLSGSSTSNSYIDDFTTGFGGQILGDITADRFVPVQGYNQHFISAPVSGAALSQVSASGPDGVFVNPSTNCDETVSGYGSPYGSVFVYDDSHMGQNGCKLGNWMIKSAGNMANAKGYSVYYRGDKTLSLTGTANTGDLSIGGMNNKGVPAVPTAQTPFAPIESGWNLVGNPYPSTIDLTTLRNVEGFSNQVAIWVSTGPFSGTFQTQRIGINPHIYVAPFQAFFVLRTAAGTGSFPFYQNERTRQTNTSFYKNDAINSLVMEVDYKGQLDITTVEFNPAATNGYDNLFDASKPSGKLDRPMLFTHAVNQGYSINALPSLTDDVTVPMGLRPGVVGTMTLTPQGINSFDPTTYILLEDKKTNKWQDLRSAAYTFTTDTSDNQDRFVLHFNPAAELSATDAACDEDGSISIMQAGSATWNYVISDASGATISTGVLNKQNPINVNAVAGIYTVVLSDKNGYTVTKSIEVGGLQAAKASFTANANTVKVQETVQFTSTSNAGNCTWDFGDGSGTTGTTASHTYKAEGTYTVTLTVTNGQGCTSVTTKTIVVSNATGINTINSDNQIKIWSNENQVYIDFTKQGKVEADIELYNIIGQLLSSEKFGKSLIYTKQLANMEAAYIIVKVNNGGAVLTKKLFISNSK